MSVRILVGDCREKLRELPDGSVHCAVTSPPYFGLRDYGTAAWQGGEPDCDHVVVGARRTLWANDVKGPGSKGKNGSNYANDVKETGGACAKCGADDVKRRILEGMRAKTSAWVPGCECAADIVPATVLDPFFGAGTTGMVADRLRRNAIGIELNPHYAAMAEFRLKGDGGLFTDVASEAA